MILVGIDGGRAGYAGRTMLTDAPRARPGPTRLAEMIAYGLLVWTAGFLMIRLQQPRPTLRCLMCQPGMAACSAALLIAAVDVTTWTIDWALLDPPKRTAPDAPSACLLAGSAGARKPDRDSRGVEIIIAMHLVP